jgi:hypothetical protein
MNTKDSARAKEVSNMGRRANQTSKRQVRVRSKRLDQLDEAKLALALWLMAKSLVEGDGEASPATGQVATTDQAAELETS